MVPIPHPYLRAPRHQLKAGIDQRNHLRPRTLALTNDKTTRLCLCPNGPAPMQMDSQVRGPHGAETEPNVSSIWLMPTMLVVVVALACTGAFFFAATRGALRVGSIGVRRLRARS